MTKSNGRFVVGIDLGTTHTVVAYAERSAALDLTIFAVPRLVTPTEVSARPLFPSMLYAKLPSESPADFWGDEPWVVGDLARRRGAEVPSRLVASSKSWLSYGRVDRTAPILPWGSSDEENDTPRISPLDAAARLLGHVRAAWNQAFDGEPLETQDVVLTVPASFDEVARELTLEASRRAGLSVRLLEEPQAAFYDFINHVTTEELLALVDRAGGEARVLVCDTGGGTTDLSLVKLVRGAGARPLEVVRVAVGHHLLLGGDNMDLALAHTCEARLVERPARLDPTRFAELVLACRSAKEKLLGDGAPESMAVTVLARGSSLVGGTLSTRLTREEVERLVIEGFFPKVDKSATPDRSRSALVAFGLPYERDAALTRHIAYFLARHAPGERVHALLLNGGIFHAPRIVERLVSVLASWGGASLDVLPHRDPDLAVARGAVRYGLARAGIGLRIEAGAARGYYLGLGGKRGEAASLVCVVPRGAKEGVAHVAEGRSFALKVGRPVRFELFVSDEADDQPGAVVPFDEERFEALPPALVTFETAGRHAAEVTVALEGELSPIGTLDLACVELGADAVSTRRFRLAFDLRGDGAPPSSMPPSLATGANVSVRTLAAEAKSERETVKLAQAREAIEVVFGKSRPDSSPRKVKDLLRDLEKILGERANWTTEATRTIYDVLLSDARSRRRTPDHERLFWLLAGYCVRPGFGDANDPVRVRELFALFDERVAFVDEPRTHPQFWIAYRRAAGGLDEAAQVHIRDITDPLLAPAEKRLKKPKGWKLEAEGDLIDLVGSLERVPQARRSELGGWLLERTWTDRDPRIWAAIGRIGARTPAYASVHHVVSSIAAGRWLDHLLREKWDGARELQQAAVRLSRVTDDRARDVPETLRRDVERRLVAAGAPEPWVRAVREFVPIAEDERSAFFGESLPVGLRLLDEDNAKVEKR